MIERYRNGRESGCGVDKNENEKDRERGVGRGEVVVRETTVLSLVTGLCAFSLFDLLFLFFSLKLFNSKQKLWTFCFSWQEVCLPLPKRSEGTEEMFRKQINKINETVQFT